MNLKNTFNTQSLIPGVASAISEQAIAAQVRETLDVGVNGNTPVIEASPDVFSQN